ncbi:MAG: ECF transporter S component [Oscillospiraceae bacterium]
MKNNKTRRIAITAMFAAVATVLMYFELPLPFMPPFLKVDPSSIAILIGSFILGPVSGIAMAFIKAFVHFFSSGTGGVGELADFIITASFAVSASVVYRRHHTKRGAVLACAVGTVAISIAGVLANKFLLLPFFSQVMPVEAIFEACGAVNPFIHDTNSYLLFGALPFNLIKGVLVSLLTFPVYKKLSVHIKRFISELDGAPALGDRPAKLQQ